MIQDFVSPEEAIDIVESRIRVLVTGSRDWPNRGFVHHALDLAFCEIMDLGKTMMLVHGACPSGADYFADEWFGRMLHMGFDLDIQTFPANWTRYGKSAGYIRNARMVEFGADVCLAFIHNESNGASNCAELAEKAEIETHRHISTFVPAA